MRLNFILLFLIAMILSALCAQAEAGWLCPPTMRQSASTPTQFYVSNSFGGAWPTHVGERFWSLDFKHRDHWLHGQWWATYDRPVLASAPGVVSRVGYSPFYGHYVWVRHNSTYTTLYSHLNHRSVFLGQSVNRHTIIGLQGASGIPGSENPHYHFALLRTGTWQTLDPRPHLGISNLAKGTGIKHL